MATTSTPKTYKHIQITNSSEGIWVSPLESYEKGLKISKSQSRWTNNVALYIILMGPTGAGKSRFIEAIASKSSREPLGISKDQLESVTQAPSFYEIKNLKYEVKNVHGKIYIMDTPGLVDPRISEFKVLETLTYWRNKCHEDGFVRILYFHPISDKRVPATREGCIQMMQNFWGIRVSPATMLITSMWNHLPERSIEAAESRLNELSTRYWGPSSLRTHSNPQWRFLILHATSDDTRTRDEHPNARAISQGLGMEGTEGNPVYEALLQRISSLEKQHQTLVEDLARPETQGQAELFAILTNDLAKNELLLQQFTTEIENLLNQLNPSQETQLTLPKRLRRWVHKKVDKMHLGGFNRKAE